MEQLTIQYFGPIAQLDIEVKDLNVYIGSTATGKSTVAKLIAIFSSLAFHLRPDIASFQKQLTDYNIGFALTNNTYISYESRNAFWKLRSGELSTNLYKFQKTFNLLESFSFTFRSANTNRLSDNQADDSFLNWSLFSIYSIKQADTEAIENELDSLIDAHAANDIRPILKQMNEARDEMVQKNPSLFLPLPEWEALIQNFISLITRLFTISNIIYVPAERVALSMLAEANWSLNTNRLSFPFCFKDFGAKFESARIAQRSFDINALDARYEFGNGENVITTWDGSTVKLEQASSGFQSLVPMYAVIDYYTGKQDLFPNLFIFEEPELNLYPTVQKKTVEFIIKSCKAAGARGVITTHSPYVLTSLDNMIQANNTFRNNQDVKDSVAGLVPQELWISFDHTTCYYFEQGTARSTLDADNRTLGSSNIDDVSEELGSTYEKLLDLKYN